MKIIHKITIQEAIEAYKSYNGIDKEVIVEIEEIQLTGGSFGTYTPNTGINGITPLNGNLTPKPCPDGKPGCCVIHY